MDPQVASQCTDSNSLGRVVMKYLVFKIRNPSGVLKMFLKNPKVVTLLNLNIFLTIPQFSNWLAPKKLAFHNISLIFIYFIFLCTLWTPWVQLGLMKYKFNLINGNYFINTGIMMSGGMKKKIEVFAISFVNYGTSHTHPKHVKHPQL